MVLKKLFSEEKAVSPVIAVMLMIVVTVILAAAVSSYAGSMSTQEAAPQATLKSSASLSAGYVTLEHLGGDILTKSNIVIEIASGTPQVSGYVDMVNVTFTPQENYLRSGDVAKISFETKKSYQDGDPWDGSGNTGPLTTVFKGELISQSVAVGTPFKVSIIDKESGQTVYTSTVVMNP